MRFDPEEAASPPPLPSPPRSVPSGDLSHDAEYTDVLMFLFGVAHDQARRPVHHSCPRAFLHSFVWVYGRSAQEGAGGKERRRGQSFHQRIADVARRLCCAVLEARSSKAADQIQSQTKDPQVQRNALLWKINAISACYRAALVEDPLLGYVDVVILCRQMEIFFTTGPGRNSFWRSAILRGPDQP